MEGHQGGREPLERRISDLREPLDAFLDEVAAAEPEGGHALAAELARALRAELFPRGDDADEARAGRDSELLLQALREAHQPLRESVLYERVRERGAALSPDEFVALAYDLVTWGLVRVTVEHDLPSHDPPPFQPRFYRPAT